MFEYIAFVDTFLVFDSFVDRDRSIVHLRLVQFTVDLDCRLVMI